MSTQPYHLISQEATDDMKKYLTVVHDWDASVLKDKEKVVLDNIPEARNFKFMIEGYLDDVKSLADDFVRQATQQSETVLANYINQTYEVFRQRDTFTNVKKGLEQQIAKLTEENKALQRTASITEHEIEIKRLRKDLEQQANVSSMIQKLANEIAVMKENTSLNVSPSAPIDTILVQNTPKTPD